MCPLRQCPSCEYTLKSKHFEGVFVTPSGDRVRIYSCPMCRAPYSEREDAYIPVSQGYREYDDTCGLAWLYFDRRLDEAEIASACCANNLYYYYGGPGQPFRDEPYSIKTCRRTLLLQRRGLDV